MREDGRWRRTSEIYHAALLRSVPDRAAFVRDACGDDEALRRDVESLLALDGLAQNLMNTPAAVAAGAVLPEILVSMVGRQLGPYRVTSLLGTGGMGEVYRARDTKLSRDVAIKVLPPDLAADRDRLARFGREAQILASLNHPNIAGIHHLVETDGVVALVMELVDGETLADRIARAPIALDEALMIARQICEALEAAHEHGIIHRDLKPANIKVRPDGTVKVLDFGLAKLNDPNASNISSDPNTLSMTGEGVLLGTAAYMAPEQARGATIDRRVDVWAFGCVLFEMLTGRLAFAGSDASDVLANVIKSEPDWTLLPASVSPNVRSLLRRCLHKDPRQRVRDIADVRLAIEDSAAQPVPHAARSATLPYSARIAWIAATALLLSTVILLWLHLRPAAPPPVQLLSILPPDGASIYSGTGDLSSGTLAVSPDGRHLAFTATSAGTRMLWIRALDSATGSPLAGTEGAALPFWSPDGRDIGTGGEYLLFARQQSVLAQRIDTNNWVVDGEPIQVSQGTVAEAERAAFAVFSTSASGLIAYLPGVGPDQRELVWMDRLGKPAGRVGGPASYEHVELSPDGKHIAVDRTDAQFNTRDIWLVDVATGTPSRFTFEPSQYNTPRWSPDGNRLLFARVAGRKGIYQKRFDGATPEEQLLAATHDGITLAGDWSPDERSIVFYDEPPAVTGRLWLLPLSGDARAVPLRNGERGFNGRFSPDGRWLAYQLFESGRNEIYVQPLPASGAKWQLSRDGGVRPRWRKDGKELYFMAPDGTLMAASVATTQRFEAGAPTPIFQIRYSGLNAQYPYDVSRDGQRFLVISPVERRQPLPATVLLNWRPPPS